jgi:hypothetical protein
MLEGSVRSREANVDQRWAMNMWECQWEWVGIVMSCRTKSVTMTGEVDRASRFRPSHRRSKARCPEIDW